MRTATAAVLAWLCAGCLDTQPDMPTSAALNASDAGKGSDKPPVAARTAAGGAGGASAKVVPVAQVTAHGGSGGSQPTAAGSGGAGEGGHMPSEPSPMRQGDLVITELMIDPKALPDTQGEWFELYNASGSELSLHDCKLDDGVKSLHAIAEPLRLQPGEYATFARSASPGFTPSATLAFSLTNSADTLAIICGGREIDRVSYDKAAGFPIESGASLSLDPEALSAQKNDDPSAWCLGQNLYNEDFGTPGRANPSCHEAEDPDAGVEKE